MSNEVMGTPKMLDNLTNMLKPCIPGQDFSIEFIQDSKHIKKSEYTFYLKNEKNGNLIKFFSINLKGQIIFNSKNIFTLEIEHLTIIISMANLIKYNTIIY